jgi:hypothetical protein
MKTKQRSKKSVRKDRYIGLAKPKVKRDYHHGAKDVTEADLIGPLNEDLREAWEKLRSMSVGLGEQRIYASHRSIMFSKKVCYCFVRPRKSFLEVWIFLKEPLTDWIREAFGYCS